MDHAKYRADTRFELMLPYVKGKTVLDMGAGDMRHRSLHPYLCQHAKKVVGLELYKDRVVKNRKLGYDIRLGNAETTDIKERFDCVVGGDIIEHVDNPGLFIDNCMLHLKPGGTFIFNTPNIYSINFLLRGLFTGHVEMFYEHSVGLNEQLIRELLNRRNLKPEKLVYFTHKNNNIPSWTIRTLALLNKEWHENIFVVVRKK
jgi:2-polyprenyl-3-methyl-5-hydroxy-6-metoxy-1,4-benzoquinol methylase